MILHRKSLCRIIAFPSSCI
ncbi:short open reading frame, partial (plasmid) [Vibrio sp. 16]